MPTITELPTATSVTPDDGFLMVDDPTGVSPSTQRGRISDILSLAVALLSGVQWQGTWSNATTYSEGDVVSYNGDVYISLTNSNLNQDPTTEDTEWQKWVAQGPPGSQGEQGNPGTVGQAGLPSQWDAAEWSTGIYTKGTAVRHPVDGASYVAVVDSATTDPISDSGFGGSWRKISERGAQGAKPFNTPVQWAPSTAYSAGDETTPADAVLADDASWVCIVNHTSSASFGDDYGTKWQMIAAPGGVASVSGVSPVNVDLTNPALPEVSLDVDVPGGVPTIDGGGYIHRAQLARQVIRFTHTSQPGGSDGNIGGTGGTSGGTSGSNGSYANKVEIARIRVPGDSSSTGDNAYQRRDELEATLTFDMDMSDSEHVACYLTWVKNTGSERINPTYLTPHAIANGVSTNGLVTAHVRAWAPAMDAEDAETYILYAWVKNNGGFIHDTTSGGSGYLDVVSATSHPVIP